MTANDDDDFFIGWSADVPKRTGAFARRAWVGALLLGLSIAAYGAISQAPFAKSRFEFGVERAFEGRIEHIPYPTLVVDRPGDASGASSSRWLLTVFGKRGAEEFTEPLDGHRVRVIGSLIYRGAGTMVEILPGSLEDLGAVARSGSPRAKDWFPSDPVSPVVEAGGAAPMTGTFTGEIVDSKCFLGVMKPGNLKTHRACAIRCISGGVPPVLVVRGESPSDPVTYLLLVDADGKAVNDRVLDYVAEPIALRGTLKSFGDMHVLHADPGTITRL